ncbi:MAG: hypothetical protein ACD_22C00136G0007 [uncultured bacterium]|nr:MAG: hypothetical protein ACD_22C00136G0007 [uncultured bacterium]
MCGIAGKYSKYSPVTEIQIDTMCQVLYHRGPDDKGLFVDANFGFGMRRLSIIDVEGGKQPIFNEDKSKTIVFNGEIYNYKQLKKDLEEGGHVFSTNSDTEAVLHCFEQYGEDCVNKLEGMFAFAIWDIKSKSLFMARDHLGIKPLYYYLDDKMFLFGSEIKAILTDSGVRKKINPTALNLYLAYMYIPSPYSIFENVHKLPAGHLLWYKSEKLTVRQYWDVKFVPNNTRSNAETIATFHELLGKAVKSQMISDVPLGAFLSGGLDSSTIVSKMVEHSNTAVKTFSIGFKEGGYYDESYYAELVAKTFHTDHVTFKVDAQMFDFLPKYSYYFDEPFADYAAFPTYVLSELARKHVTVVLTGDGGDEIFAGYTRYTSELLSNQYLKIPKSVRDLMAQVVFKNIAYMISSNSRKRNYFEKVISRTKNMDKNPFMRYVKNITKLDSADRKTLLNEDYIRLQDEPLEIYLGIFHNISANKMDQLSGIQYLDIKKSLPDDMLTKVDRVTMAASLEARVPFLDRKLVEFAATIPSSKRLSILSTKKLMKNAMRPTLSSEIVDRPKHGFGSPMEKWLRSDLKCLTQDVLSRDSLRKSAVFDSDYVEQLVSQHMSGVKNNGVILFMLIAFQMWFREYMK